MVKVLSFSFEQYCGHFTMLLVKGSSEAGLLRHLSDLVYENPQVKKNMRYEGHLFFENIQNSI